MKKLLLFTMIMACTFAVWSQSLINQSAPYSPHQLFEDEQVMQRAKQQKGPNTQVYYEDFDGALPAGWTFVNPNTNCSWQWDTLYRPGQFTTGISRMLSTTASNGFLLLPIDLCNTPTASPMDNLVVSPAIPIPQMAVVYVRFEQYLVYCCNASNDLVLECSTDGLTWDTYDAVPNLGVNVLSTNPQELTINVTNTLANADTAYLRFRASGSTAYFWMLDDLEILDGDSTSLLMQDFRNVFSRNHQFNPTYTTVPRALMEPIEFEADVLNDGFFSQNGVTTNVNIFNEAGFGGAPGFGQVSSLSSTLGSSILSQEDTTIVVDNPAYINLRSGDFRVDGTISSPLGVGSSPGQFTRRFSVGDTVFARDDGGYGGTAGPSDYVGGGNDNDAWGLLYEMLGDSGVATSISIYVPNDTDLVGVAIQPRIWPFDDSQATIGAAIGNPLGIQPFSTTIGLADLDSWLVLPYLTAPLLEQDSQYVVGWEQISGAANGLTFSAARDGSSSAIAPDVTNFCFLNEAGNARWFWVPTIAAVRLNFGPNPANGNFVVGLNEAKDAEFKMMPNPANNQVFIQFDKNQSFNLELIDMKGRVVLHKRVTDANSTVIDVSGFDSGIYYLRAIDENGSRTQKLIVY